VSILFALLSAFTNACTAVMQRLASKSVPTESKGVTGHARHLVRQPVWVLGMVLMGATFAFQAIALYFGQLAVVQPVLVLELIFALALRRLWLRDRIATRTWGAAALTCAGLAGFLLIAHPREGHRVPGVTAWVVALSVRGALVLVLLVLGRRGSPARRAGLLGAAAALVWSVDAAFVKAMTDLLSKQGWLALLVHWPLYGVIVTGILGTVLLQAAFAAGPLSMSQSVLLIVDSLASITLGVELFGETLNDSALAITFSVVALAVMSVGVIFTSLWAPPPMTPRAGPSPALRDADGVA